MYATVGLFLACDTRDSVSVNPLKATEPVVTELTAIIENGITRCPSP